MAEPAEHAEERLLNALLYVLLRSGTAEAPFLVKELVDQRIILEAEGILLLAAIQLRINRNQ